MSEVARLELEIRSPLQDAKLPEVDWNFTELKYAIGRELERYKGLMYTEDTVKTAKEDRAKLNKLKEIIDAERKRIKKQYLEPYEAFEAQIKELTAMIDKPATEIDNQIKAFDEKRREEKKAGLIEFFNSEIGDLKGLVSFEKIFDSKWLNVTVSMINAVTEIGKKVQKVRDELTAVEALDTDPDRAAELKAIYFRSLNLSDAIKENELRKTERAAVKEREKAKQQEMAYSAPAADSAPTKVEEKAKEAKPLVNEDGEVLHEMCFRVVATKQGLQALKQCFIDNNIKYGRI